jgi:hypothetical protein
MNKRQVIILWAIALVLGVSVATVKSIQNRAVQNATKRVQGQTLFESFPANQADTIQLQDATASVTLARKDGKWTVAERDGYPANTTYVNDFLRTLAELKITLGMEAGPKFAQHFGMDESSSNPEDRGLTATFKDAAGAEIAKVSLGKTIESGSTSPMDFMGGNAVGRYVRNHADESGFYAVSEMFPSVSAEARRWLADGFINIEKIKSITVSEPEKGEPLWQLTRESEEAEFKLTGATGAEVLDTTATSPLKSIFSYARFDDVVPAADLATRAATEGKRIAVIETVEGFTYTIEIIPAKPAASDSEDTSPAADNYFMTVAVAADLPKERKKEADEKPEDATAKDTAFTEQLKLLTEKLAKEKAFAGTTFEISKTTVEPLLKDRAGLITTAEPATETAADAGAVQTLPGGMIARPPVTATTEPIQAVTPPISIPAADEEAEEPAQED